MIDETWLAECNRLSPEAPVPVALLKSKYSCLGGAANVARNIRALDPDIDIHLAGYIGCNFQYLLDNDRIKLWPAGLVEAEQTNIKLRIVDTNKGYHLIRVDNEEFVECKDRPLPIEGILSWLRDINPDSVIISDYCKGAIWHELAARVITNIQGKQIFVDTRRDDLEMFYNANWITPNKHEFARIQKYMRSQQIGSFATDPQVMSKFYGFKGMLLTRGSEGMDLYVNSNSYHRDSVNHDIIDVTGAGDTALAAFTLLKTADLLDNEYILEVTNTIAGEVCMERGTVVPKKTLDKYISEYPTKNGHTKKN